MPVIKFIGGAPPNHWPDHVPLQTRLEVVKAHLTLNYHTYVKFPDAELDVAVMFKGDSNGAGFMLRCIGGYDGVKFTEAWAEQTLQKHFEVLKSIEAIA